MGDTNILHSYSGHSVFSEIAYIAAVGESVEVQDALTAKILFYFFVVFWGFEDGRVIFTIIFWRRSFLIVLKRLDRISRKEKVLRAQHRLD